MEIRLFCVLLFITLFITTDGRSVEKIITLRELDIQNFKANDINLSHVIEKRDEQYAAAGETLEDVKKLGEDYVSNLENLQDDVSQNLNRVGDETSKNVERIGEEVNK